MYVLTRFEMVFKNKSPECGNVFLRVLNLRNITKLQTKLTKKSTVGSILI